MRFRRRRRWICRGTSSRDPRTGAPLFLNSFNVFRTSRIRTARRSIRVWVGPQYLPPDALPNDWTVGDGLNTAGYRWLRASERDRQRHRQTPRPPTATSTTCVSTIRSTTTTRCSIQLTKEDNWGVTGQTGLPDLPGRIFRRSPPGTRLCTAHRGRRRFTHDPQRIPLGPESGQLVRRVAVP